jgi:hypothetical protein
MNDEDSKQAATWDWAKSRQGGTLKECASSFFVPPPSSKIQAQVGAEATCEALAMSLFEDDRFTWRETYFVFFDEKSRPSKSHMEKFLKDLGGRYDVRDVRTDDQGLFESATVLAPDDYAGMDVTYVSGEEVREQLDEMLEDIGKATLNVGQVDKLTRLSKSDARFDVYHFEQVASGEDDEDEMLDPGALLIVLERLAKLCNGVGFDPQTGTLM